MSRGLQVEADVKTIIDQVKFENESGLIQELIITQDLQVTVAVLRPKSDGSYTIKFVQENLNTE